MKKFCFSYVYGISLVNDDSTVEIDAWIVSIIRRTAFGFWELHLVGSKLGTPFITIPTLTTTPTTTQT